VNGNVNGVSIQEQDLHCYIVTADGRTYTAISRIPPDVGWDIQVSEKDARNFLLSQWVTNW
jgi:nidogen (entactin)